LPFHGFYLLSFQQVGADGRLGTQMSESTYFDATPFLDGRQQALDNLTFALRAGDSTQPFNFEFGTGPFSAGLPYGFFPDYAVAGFRWMRHIYAGTPETL